MRRVKATQNPNQPEAVEHDEASASSEADEAPPPAAGEHLAGAAAPSEDAPNESPAPSIEATSTPSVPGGAPGLPPPPPESHPAILPGPLDESEHPKTSQWRVTNQEGRRVALSGGVVNLVKGKIVDNANYDIDLLISAGVQLEPVEG